MGKQVYRYFVSYHVDQGRKFGYGNVFVPMAQPIETMEQVRAIADRIERDFSFPPNSVAVLNYIFMKESVEASTLPTESEG